MKSLWSAAVLAAGGAALLARPSPARQSRPASGDEAAIREAALNYMDGALSADADRVALGIHPELNKMRRVRLAPGGTESLLRAGASRLLAFTRAMPQQQESWETEVTVFDTGEGIAQARAVSPWFYDLLQLVRMDGKWRIVNVLWETNRLEDGSPYPASDRAAEEPGVRQAALDYIEGYYAGDESRMERALSTQLNKVRLAVHPATGGQLLDYSPYPLMIEATRLGGGKLPEAERAIRMTVHDISHGLAAVSITSARFIDHVQLAKLNGAWKVVNVLWVMNPESGGAGGSRGS